MHSHKLRVVVSAENNPYSAWQVKLFYFSCVSRLRHQPLVIIHDTGGPPHPYFLELIRAGAMVRRAPSYAVTAWADVYKPRNTAGTLLHAAEVFQGEDDLIVLCDQDMLFAREPSFPAKLSADYYSYMDYSSVEVLDAARRLGIGPRRLRAYGEELKCGVPYVIPATAARRLARGWLEAVDAFAPRRWTDIMHAFGLAVVKLGFKIALNRTVDFNMSPDARLTREVIHYCYGSEAWDKRHYMTDEQARRVWFPSCAAAEGTVLAEIVSQINGARQFYANPFFAEP